MRTRLGGDEELVAEVIRLFLRDYSRHLDDLRAASAARDLHTIRRTAHFLKGSAGTFSADDVVSAADALIEIDASVAPALVDTRVATLAARVEQLGADLRALPTR